MGTPQSMIAAHAGSKPSICSAPPKKLSASAGSDTIAQAKVGRGALLSHS